MSMGEPPWWAPNYGPGPLMPLPMPPVYHPPGCICPPTSEKTCRNPMCPRGAGPKITTSGGATS